ncbi:MAG: hypothetical protein PW789_07830 [Edaphobacter sp.]|uniref:hypothetical protein n=1 Tax=Edaphobacter sp. TaxID=1934404 RepID=UPI00239B32F4|nr:hypothetical protein [Edaphobacter sp.]MDE1176502.1 hypothetical protein [Edaphobacter sp.]
MRYLLLLGLLAGPMGTGLAQTAQPPLQFFGYQRSVVPVAAGPNCAVIDAGVFAHAGVSLKDLRLYPRTAKARDLPYAITLSEPEQPDTDPAGVLNLGMRDGRIVFDLAMPSRPYTSVMLDLAGRDFIATATVTGVESPGGKEGTRLGDFTLFDLSSQHLSRSTTLALEESSFPYLHVELNTVAAPGAPDTRFLPQMVLGARVPPSREAQSIYSLAVQSSNIVQGDRKTVIHLRLPERVPVERVSFVLESDFHGNFSRDVTITDHPVGTQVNTGEFIDGNIFHVEMTQAGRQIRQQRLSIPATLGSNLQTDAEVEVTIKNGDDSPLPVQAVRLEMRERRLCFQAASDAPLTLFYGDSALQAPQYDFARTFSPMSRMLIARVGPEQKNPAYTPRPDTRAATERHPELVWIVFLAVVCLLALIALRSSRHVPR